MRPSSCPDSGSASRGQSPVFTQSDALSDVLSWWPARNAQGQSCLEIPLSTRSAANSCRRHGRRYDGPDLTCCTRARAFYRAAAFLRAVNMGENWLGRLRVRCAAAWHMQVGQTRLRGLLLVLHARIVCELRAGQRFLSLLGELVHDCWWSGWHTSQTAKRSGHLDSVCHARPADDSCVSSPAKQQKALFRCRGRDVHVDVPYGAAGESHRLLDWSVSIRCRMNGPPH